MVVHEMFVFIKTSFNDLGDFCVITGAITLKQHKSTYYSSVEA